MTLIVLLRPGAIFPACGLVFWKNSSILEAISRGILCCPGQQGAAVLQRTSRWGEGVDPYENRIDHGRRCHAGHVHGGLDVLMENGLVTDGAIGVSAGAVFGCNYKSHQIGRVIRYNTEYCNDKRYASFKNLVKTGNLYSEQFCYHEVPEKLDPFNEAAFAASPMDFFVVCTDVKTGEPIYHKCRKGDAEDVLWMEASASMPLAAKIVKIGHYGLLDGGVADSIPVRFFESIGYKRNLIILTQPKGYIKKKNKFLPAIRAKYFRYPAFVEAVADRHERYNETLSYISMLEQAGKDYVIRWRSVPWSGTPPSCAASMRPAGPWLRSRSRRSGIF